MLNQEQALKLIEKEINIIIELSKNIDENLMNYRPKDNMRSTQELLTYLQNCAYGMLAFWTQSEKNMKDFFTDLRAATPTIDLSNFEERMNLQKSNLQNAFATISKEDWQTKMVTYPWGEQAPLGEALIHSGLKWLTAYKYQLFMYIKMGSENALTTPDVWVKGS